MASTTPDSMCYSAWTISNISDHSQITTVSSKDPETREKSIRVRVPIEDPVQPSGVRWEMFALGRDQANEIAPLTNAPDNHVCLCVSCSCEDRAAATHKVSNFRLARLLTGLDTRLTAGEVEVPTEDDEAIFIVHRAEQLDEGSAENPGR